MAQAEARHYINAAHDNETRRKKTTMEKAKANYLCSQLRIRLQYAKLKVDHGWQKQTLNEVENLYFRHSQTNRQHFNTVNTDLTNSQQTTASNGVSSASQSQTNRTTSTATIESTSSETSIGQSNSQPRDDQMSSVMTQQSSKTTTPRQPSRQNAKGKERDHSLPTSLFNGLTSTPTLLLSPSKRTNRTNSRHTPIVEDFPPATLADGGLQSSAKYLSNTYISSSPFPINIPMSSQEIPPPTSPFGKLDQALTYDSFWSSHSTWSSHLSIASTGSPAATTPANSQNL